MPSLWKAPRITLKDVAKEADLYWSPREEAYVPNMMGNSMATRLDDQIFRSFTFRLTEDFYFSRWNKQKADEIEKLTLAAWATNPPENTRVKPENAARYLKQTVFNPASVSSMPGRYWGDRKHPGMVQNLIKVRDFIKIQFPEFVAVIDWLNKHIVAVDTIRESTESMVRRAVKAGLKKLNLDDPRKYGGPRRTKLGSSAVQRIADAWVTRRIAQDLWQDQKVSPRGVRYPRSKWDKLKPQKPFDWATPAAIRGKFPEPWRVTHPDFAENWLKRKFRYPDLYADRYLDTFKEKIQIWIGLRNNRDQQVHNSRVLQMYENLKKEGWPARLARDGSYLLLMDDIERDALR